jgi:hypothetical protein
MLFLFPFFPSTDAWFDAISSFAMVPWSTVGVVAWASCGTAPEKDAVARAKVAAAVSIVTVDSFFMALDLLACYFNQLVQRVS